MRLSPGLLIVTKLRLFIKWLEFQWAIKRLLKNRRLEVDGYYLMTQNLTPKKKNEIEKKWWRRFLNKLAEANEESLRSGCKT